MAVKDGSVGFDFSALYEAIEPGKAITLALDDGRRVHTTFNIVDGGTRVETVFDAESENRSTCSETAGWRSSAVSETIANAR